MRITQFKPTLYILLLLGITGFAMAAESPGIWLLGCGGVALNGWLVYTGRFRPLPRLLANLITIGSMLFVARQLFGPASSAVLVIGQFLVVLQIVKLWEQRANRDYAQLLVLSLLLMVAASINTSSLLFGVVLIGYLFVSLYCCLLFHLKVETDKATAALPVPEEKVSPNLVRQDQRFLARSMRRLSAVIATGSILTAVFVFLIFPRGSGQNMLVPAQMRIGQALTGFSDQVNFDQVARIQQNDRIIAYTTVTKDGRKLAAGDTVYLRGVAMDRYRGSAVDASIRERRQNQWRGGFIRDTGDFKPVSVARGFAADVRRPGRVVSAVLRPDGTDITAAQHTYTQKMSLSPTGTRVLFVVSGTGGARERVATAFSVTPYRDLSVITGTDHALQTEDPITGPIDYELVADDAPQARDLDSGEFNFGFVGADAFDSTEATDPRTRELVPALRDSGRVKYPPLLRSFGFRDNDLILDIDGKPVADFPENQRSSAALAALRSGRMLTILRSGARITTLPYVSPDILKYALQPSVSGVDDEGKSLAAQRNRLSGPTPIDEEIATSISRHLRSEFSYTLDISDSASRRDMDPIVWFLSPEGRRGHCEYFAGAMALMCQSLGLNARVVVGFKTDEFNPYSDQFIVRQSHAHAWVEVLTTEGWMTYDPTSSRDVDMTPQDYGLFQQAKHFFNWLEFSYANNVIAYDNDSRESLIQAIESQMTQPLYAGVNEGWITRNISDSKFYRMLTDPDSAVVSWLVIVVVATVCFFVGRNLLHRWRLRRRAQRIGLAALPEAEQFRLAQQLGFYDDLLLILERRSIERPQNLTPLEFARSLLFLPAGAYETVRRLTEVFYRVRYGQQSLDTGSQKRLSRVITRLDEELGPVAPTLRSLPAPQT